MGKVLSYRLEPGGFVNRCLFSGPFLREEEFEKCVLHGRVNEWLKKGFAIHENPCRKEFVANRAANPPVYRDFDGCLPGDLVEEFEQELPLRVYFPFGNIRVDDSAFYFNPTYLRSYCVAYILAERDEEAGFEIETCGGATIWANGGLVCDFAPFTRNMRKSQKITIALKKGVNQITICLDDLAERDTDYYYGLRYLGGQQLTMQVPVKGGVDEARVKAAEEFLADMCFEKEAYIDEPLVLASADAPFDMQLEIESAPAISTLVDVRDNALGSFSVKVGAGQSEFTLRESEKLLPEYYYFRLLVNVDGICVSTLRGTQVLRKEMFAKADEDIEVRRQTALRYLADTGVRGVYRAAALCYLDEEQQLREEMIAADLKGIRKRRDCSDFYFVVVLYLYKAYGDKMSDALKNDIKETALGFRYWMDEPGDDVMWFFSENHALLFHLCQYFAGTLFPEDVFTNSGFTGVQQVEKAQKLLDVWFKEFFAEFITEWNSSAYIPVDVVGFATLYNFAEDGSVLKKNAKKALDMIFRCIAMNALDGVNAVTFGRSYEEQLRGRYVAGTTSLLYLGYGKGWLNRCGMGYISVAMGSYVPPAEYAQYINLEPGKRLVFQNTQGFEGHVNTYLYKTEKAVLSTAVNFNPFKPGYQECVVQAAVSGLAQAFISHPGEVQPYGKGRPNHWAGNGELPRAVQYLGTALLHYEISEGNLIDYTHAYLPLVAFDKFTFGENYVVAEKNGAYIGLLAQNGVEMQKNGPYRNREIISRGRSNVWVLEVADSSQFESLDEFAKYMAAFKLQKRANGEIALEESRYGSFVVCKNGSLEVNGEAVYEYPLTAEGKLALG